MEAARMGHEPSIASKAMMNFGAAIVQILILDIVFSIDSILTRPWA